MFYTEEMKESHLLLEKDIEELKKLGSKRLQAKLEHYYHLNEQVIARLEGRGRMGFLPPDSPAADRLLGGVLAFRRPKTRGAL